jgi:hypothetical protein
LRLSRGIGSLRRVIIDIVSAFERNRETFRITTDTAAMDVDAIHAYLARSYWSEGIPKPLVARAMAGSLCFGLLDGGRQIGFARASSPIGRPTRICATSTCSRPIRGAGWAHGSCAS